MKKYLSIFKNMNVVDWVLAVLFVALVAIAVNLLFPPTGWLLGIPAALVLLYIAKKRRDRIPKE
jgi:hypothetical protein